MALAFMLFVSPATATTRTIFDTEPCLALVSIEVRPENTVGSYAVAEYLTPTLIPFNITEGGLWDSESRTIRWGPFADSNSRLLTYELQGANIAYSIYGVISFDGQSEPITGDSEITINCLNEPQKTATPSFQPISGTQVPVEVIIFCETEGAQIHYTFDGSLPNRYSPFYESPLTFDKPVHLRARAFQQDRLASEVALSIYPEPLDWNCEALTRTITFNRTCSPQILVQVNPKERVSSWAVEEILPQELIPYDISENGAWDVVNHRIKWGPFSETDDRIFTYKLAGLAGTYTINGGASFDGKYEAISGPTELIISGICDRVTTPSFNPPTGTNLPAEVTILCATPEAEIHYTLDGSEPNILSPLYTEPLDLTKETFLKARAYQEGLFYSQVAEAYYPEVYTVAMLTRSIDNHDNCSALVTVKVVPDESARCYAIEEIVPYGLAPSDMNEEGTWDRSTRKIKWGPFTDNQTRLLRYVLTGAIGNYSITGVGSFDGETIDTDGEVQVIINGHELSKKVQDPVFDTPSGVYEEGRFITITCQTPAAQIRYTTDGSLPDMGSLPYFGPLYLTHSMNIRAIAFGDRMEASEVVSRQYIKKVEAGKVTLKRTIKENETCTPQMRLEVKPDDLVKCYAVEERLPLGLSPFQITSSGIWDQEKRMLRWGPFNDQAARIFTYRISGFPGTYTMSYSVSLNGKVENLVAETPITITCFTGLGQPKTATPIFDPPSGTPSPIEVTISCATEGAAIHYTLDGSLPDQNSPLYSHELSLTTTTNLRARAFQDGLDKSEIASAIYPLPSKVPAQIGRTVSDNYSCSPLIHLSIIPDEDVFSYAIEESLPFGLSAVNISHDGLWDEEKGKVKWGPFINGGPQGLTYSVIGEFSLYTSTIEGKVSFDGHGFPISGDSEVIIDCEAPKGLSVIEGNCVLYLNWQPIKTTSGQTASGYKIYYGTETGQYTGLIDAKNECTYFPIEGLINDTLYYLTVTAYDQNGHESGHAPGIFAIPSTGAGKLGFISFDRAFYNTQSPDTAIITLKEADLNTTAESIQEVDIMITSTSDSSGITIALAETDRNSGIFTSAAYGRNLGFTQVISDDENELIKIADGDTITAVYQDQLPLLARSAKARIDLTPPVTTVIPSQTLLMINGNNYATVGCTYSLSAKDTLSGIERVEYSLNGLGYAPYVAPFSLPSEDTHTIQFKALDKADNWEAVKEFVITIDNMPPSAPQGLSGSQKDFTLTLSWLSNSEHDLKGYNVYRDGVKINQNLITSPLFSESVISGKMYSYQVTAVDQMAHESEPSASLSLTASAATPVITEPLNGTALVDEMITVRGVTEAKALVEIFVNDLPMGKAVSDSQGRFSLLNVPVVEGENSLSAVSTSAYGVTSPESSPIIILLNSRPSPVSGLSAIAGDTVVTLTWEANPEDDVIGYYIYRDTVRLNAKPIGQTEYRDLMLTNDRSYTYLVTAVDQNGIEGKRAAPIIAIPEAGPLWD